jgi:hypothetical protein
MTHELDAVVGRLEPLLAANLRYEYTQTPRAFFTQAEAERTATNCKVFAQQSAEALLGVKVPVDKQIVEAYFDPESSRPTFERVHPTRDLKVGDWVLFGRRSAVHPRLYVPRYDETGELTNWCDFPPNHVAIYGGEDRGVAQFFHATPEAGVAMHSIRTIQRQRRTEVIHEVLRLTEAA